MDAQAILRRQRADRESRLEGLAVTVLTALGERDGSPRRGRRAGQALQTMTEDEGLSVRQAVEWRGSGHTTVRKSPGYANLRTTRRAAAADKRVRCIDRLGHRSAIRAATLSASRPRRSGPAQTA